MGYFTVHRETHGKVSYCTTQSSLPLEIRSAAYRRVLWAVLAINAVIFLVEIGAGLVAGFGVLASRRPRFLW